VSENVVKIPKSEPTNYEKRIGTLRRIATLFRIFALFGGLGIPSLLGTFTYNGRIIPNALFTGLIMGIIIAAALYSLGVGFDFLADTGLIVLSMKRETQYISRVVKEVQEGRPRGD